jgi:hypothetical protein
MILNRSRSSLLLQNGSPAIFPLIESPVPRWPLKFTMSCVLLGCVHAHAPRRTHSDVYMATVGPGVRLTNRLIVLTVPIHVL